MRRLTLSAAVLFVTLACIETCLGDSNVGISASEARTISASEARTVYYDNSGGSLVVYPYIDCFTSGSTWWSWNPIFNKSRGIAVFDLRTVSSQSASVVLNVLDYRNNRSPAWTNLYWYVDDGQVTTDDWGCSATYLLQVYHLDDGTISHHDVTDVLNSLVASHTQFVGIRFEAATPDSFDSFNSENTLPSLTFSPVPEPSTLVLLAAGVIGVLAWAWRRRAVWHET